jgi:spoIIIJ-associated protein
MRTEYTVSAKTVDEAYKKAVELYSALGDISLEEVITPGKKGFLGIFGAVPAEIRISVDDGREERKPKNKPNNANEKKSQPKQANKVIPKAESKNDAPKAEKKAPVAPKAPVQKTVDAVAAKEEEIIVTVQEKTIAMNFLKSFIRDIGFNCEIKGYLTPNEKGSVPRLITIEGEDAPALIGHRGEMLDSIQYLSNLCLARKSEGEHKEYVKVIIDIENYREKREQALRALARRMAEKALKYQRNVLLEPMNPYERMIIHSEIQGIEGVSTHSVGYDENRKIVITVEGAQKRKHK